MATKQKRNRVALTVERGAEKRVRNQAIGKRLISPERIVCISENRFGTWLRHEFEQADLKTIESLDQLVAQSNDVLIILTPISFDNQPPRQNHSRRGQAVAVNVDLLTIIEGGKSGTLIRIDGAERDIFVRETPQEIEAKINGNS